MTAKLDNGNELSQCENGHADKHKKKAKEKRDVSFFFFFHTLFIINEG